MGWSVVSKNSSGATPAWAVPGLDRPSTPDASTVDLHQLRATVQLVRGIMEQTDPGDLVRVADEDPDWARRYHHLGRWAAGMPRVGRSLRPTKYAFRGPEGSF